MNVNGIIDYENGDLDETEVLDLFQDMVNTGVVWQLQGSYGRTAQQLISAGKLTPPINLDKFYAPEV